MMAIVIPRLYAATTHCRPASPTLKSDWIAGNATFTINASRKIMKRPRLVAASVKRCVLVIGRLVRIPCISCGQSLHRLLDKNVGERSFAAYAKHAYTAVMRTARKIRYRLEWLGLKSKEVHR